MDRLYFSLSLSLSCLLIYVASFSLIHSCYWSCSHLTLIELKRKRCETTCQRFVCLSRFEHEKSFKSGEGLLRFLRNFPVTSLMTGAIMHTMLIIRIAIIAAVAFFRSHTHSFTLLLCLSVSLFFREFIGICMLCLLYDYCCCDVISPLT